MYCIYNKLRSQPLWLRAYNTEISNSLSSLLLVGPQEWNPPLKLRGAGNCKCSFLLLKALWLVGFWINFKDSLDLNFELIPGSLSKERKNAASGFGEDSWQPLSLTLETYVLSYLLVWDTTWVSIVGALMWGDVCQCSSPMEQMAVSLELSYSKMNAGTVPIYQRLFLTPMDAKQVCPVIFLRQIPPVQRDPETVLCWNKQKLNGQSCYTARGSKRRGQILYTVHGNHKTWTVGVHITSLIIFVLGRRNLWYPCNPRKSLAESALVRWEKGYESWTSLPSGSCEPKGAQPNGCGTGATILLEIGYGRCALLTSWSAS